MSNSSSRQFYPSKKNNSNILAQGTMKKTNQGKNFDQDPLMGTNLGIFNSIIYSFRLYDPKWK
jgi:hypothetical protein